MPEPVFSLADLREQASRPGRAIDGGAAFTPVRDDVLLALVDAASAALDAQAMVAGARCYRRPDSKLEPDPGPCGRCAACIARGGFYDSDGYPAGWKAQVQR